jgi:3-oxoacyl-[acyl-carrier protein] reductase
MHLGLKGKNIIVTGGSSGLGMAISEQFAKEGANVIVHYNSKSKREKVIKFIEQLNETYSVNCIAVQANMENSNDVHQLFNVALEYYKHIDILINNAGIWPTSFVKDMEESDFERTLKINLQSPFLLSKKMVNHLLEQERKGKIINIVSQAAFHGSTSGHAHYAASKGGLVAFTISLAREVAEYGINVNAVAPGIMKTPMMTSKLTSEQIEERYINRIPLRRISDPEEVAYSCLFLASEKADYITGATIDVTGGMLMR